MDKSKYIRKNHPQSNHNTENHGSTKLEIAINKNELIPKVCNNDVPLIEKVIDVIQQVDKNYMNHEMYLEKKLNF